QEFTGKIAQIHPHLDAETRTLKVRFDLPNPGHVLRPGMYARVQFDAPAPALAYTKERHAGRTAADLAFHTLFSFAGPAGGSDLASLALGAGDQALAQRGQV